MKKALSILLVALMLLSLGTVAFATETAGTTNTTTLQVINATEGVDYNYYKLFDATFQNVTSGGTTTTLVTYFTSAAKKAVIDAMNDSENAAYDATCPFEVSEVETNGSYAVAVKDGVQDQAVISWLQAANAADNTKKNFEVIALSGPTAMTMGDGVATATVTSGYYYITSSLGSVVTIDSALPGVNVYDKNPSTPTTPDKSITGEGTADDMTYFENGKETNESAVGKIEQFTVTYNAVNYINTVSGGTVTTEKVTDFVITDTPTGLDIITSTVKVYVMQKPASGDPAWTEVTSTATISKNAETGVLTITLPWVDANGAHLYSAYTENMQIPVKLVYNAEILAAAATASAPNTVSVDYHREGDSDLHHVGDDTTTTYTFGFEIVKKDGNDQPLLGAEFKLLDGTTPIVFVQTANGYRVATPEEIADATVTTTDTISLTATGLNSNQAEIRGLDLGTYTLTEVTVPAGYNRAPDLTIVVTTSTEDGEKVLTKIESSSTTLGSTTIINRSGNEMPETGGMGTTIIYALGAILFLGAGIVLIARRKASQQ